MTDKQTNKQTTIYPYPIIWINNNPNDDRYIDYLHTHRNNILAVWVDIVENKQNFWMKLQFVFFRLFFCFFLGFIQSKITLSLYTFIIHKLYIKQKHQSMEI